MRTRAPLIVLALLAVAAAVFCFRACDKKPDANEESPVVASHRSFWLNAAYQTACQVEDPLIRDSLLLRLLPHFVRAREKDLAIQILEEVDDKVSAHVEYAVAARRSNDSAAYQNHMDAAFQIANAVPEDEPNDGVNMAIASTLIQAGYVEDAVSMSLPICKTSSHRDVWESEFFEKNVRELASEGHVAEARYVAEAIPSEHGPTRAYVEIAEIQRDGGDAPGATETLQEALAHVVRSRNPLEKTYGVYPDSPMDKAYCFSVIATAFAQNGDNTNAIDARARCHRTITAIEIGGLLKSDDRETAARTYAKLAHTSCLLDEPEDARRLLAQAETNLAKIGDDFDNIIYARGDIAYVWMCMNEQDAALAVADVEDEWSKYNALASILSHPSFSAEPEVLDQLVAGMNDEFDRDLVRLLLVGHHLNHGRVTEAQALVETIRGEMERDWAYGDIFEKLCEFGLMGQAIDIAARIDDTNRTYRAIKELCEHGSIEQVIDMVARIDDTHRDAAYKAIIDKHCELGSIEQAIDLAVRIDDPWTEIDVFQLIGKTLAKSRSIAELESFLTAQSKPTRLSAAYLGVLDVLVTDAEPNDRLQTDGDSAAPPPNP